MTLITRRDALRGAAALVPLASAPFASGPVWAQPTGAPRIRHDVASAAGKAMLKIYAAGVAKMSAATMAESDPRSWMFQWYTHAVRSDRDKAGELQRVYPAPSAPNRAQANAMWDTCQPHRGQREDFFLPWHRMYVLCLEQIIQTLTGKPDFTLPYWNYTDPTQRALPVEFRLANDPVFGTLFRGDRNDGVNQGTPIDQVPDGGMPINLDPMKSANYSDNGVSDAGFCGNLDHNLHGAIHVDVGNENGMGKVEWAANDPIFWLHHCNIDRIWASWNQSGGQNADDAAFVNAAFSFVNGAGAPAQTKVGSVLSTTALGYAYDNYLPRPPGSVPFPPLVAGVGPMVSAAVAASVVPVGSVGLSAASTAVTLGNAPLSVPLSLGGPSVGGANVGGAMSPFVTKLQSMAADRDFHLRLSNVRVAGPSAAGYDVYLDLPAGTAPDRANPSYVGTINMFGISSHAEHHTAGAGVGRNISLLATETVAKLRQAGRLTAVPSVLLVPIAGKNAGGSVSIGRIALVAR